MTIINGRIAYIFSDYIGGNIAIDLTKVCAFYADKYDRNKTTICVGGKEYSVRCSIDEFKKEYFDFLIKYR